MLLEDRLIVSGVRQRILGEGRGFVGGMLHKKTPPKPDLTPGPSPMGRGEHASQKTSPKPTKRLHLYNAPSLTTS